MARPALSAIKRADVHELLDKIVDRGAPIAANRTLAALRRMCSWAVERGIIDASPCEKVRAPAPETSRDRVLTDDEIRAAWGAFEGAGWPFGPLAQLLLLTGQRLREVGEARWQEVDLDAKTWTIPKERAKNGVAHEVPLSEAALRILRALPRDRGRTPGGLHFHDKRQDGRFRLLNAKEGFDKAMLAAMRKAAIERGEDPEKINRRHIGPCTIFAGRPPAAWPGSASRRMSSRRRSITRADRSRASRRFTIAIQYSAEKRAALEAWGRYLDTLLTGAPAANVVELGEGEGVRHGDGGTRHLGLRHRGRGQTS